MESLAAITEMLQSLQSKNLLDSKLPPVQNAAGMRPENEQLLQHKFKVSLRN